MTSITTALERLGFGPDLADAFEPHAAQGLVPARVAVQHRGTYVVYSEHGELDGEPAGRLRHEEELPTVGDWVAVRPLPGEARATIHAVLPRRTAFSRKTPWTTVREQVLAANVDVVLLVSSLDRDLSLRRLERYLATAWESGCRPAIVLTKLDLCEDAAVRIAEVEAMAFGVPVHAVSGVTGEGLAELEAYLDAGRTIALLGSSGVGKTTLVNRLLGEERLAVAETRASDGRGRHTTTRRELVPLPGGALVLDTPGLKELQLWDADAGVEETFADVAALAANCRFSDCGHDGEPGCAVLLAIRTGELDGARLASYRKLQRELAALHRKQDRRAAADERRRIQAQARQRRRPKRW